MPTKPFKIESIDTLLAKTGARSVLVVTQKLERYREEYTPEKHAPDKLLKLRNREDVFVTRAAQHGAKVTPMRHSEITEDKLKLIGAFDFVVIAGEITYQSFSIAANVRRLFPQVPLVVEFCEETYDAAAHKLIVKNARLHGCEDLLETLVYLTATPKSPRRISWSDAAG